MLRPPTLAPPPPPPEFQLTQAEPLPSAQIIEKLRKKLSFTKSDIKRCFFKNVLIYSFQRIRGICILIIIIFPQIDCWKEICTIDYAARLRYLDLVIQITIEQHTCMKNMYINVLQSAERSRQHHLRKIYTLKKRFAWSVFESKYNLNFYTCPEINKS